MTTNAQDLREFYDAVGRQELASAIGVTVAALTNRYAKGTMPARWFPAARAAAQENGVSCPETLFDWVNGAAA